LGASQLILTNSSVGGVILQSAAASSLQPLLITPPPGAGYEVVYTPGWTQNRLARWTDATAPVLENSLISDDGTTVEIVNGNLSITNTDGTARELRLYGPSGTNYTAFVAQAQTANITYTLPASLTPTSTVAAGILQTDGDGNLSWLTPSALVSGSAWALTGNAITAAWDGTTGNFLGTTNEQPLVIATTSTTTPQPIQIWVGNQETFRFNPPGASAPAWSIQRGGGDPRGLHAVDLQSERSAATQVASGDYSVIGGGADNTASGAAATVGGGYANTAIGWYATVGGGQENIAIGDFATIGGGIVNTASGFFATVGGGVSNTASGDLATVGGGQDNTAIGDAATVGGGLQNTASGNLATIGGGLGNIASGGLATVGGGHNNIADGTLATVGGGKGNTARGELATVGGGHSNTVGGDYATVGGGRENTAGGDYATVGGGELNRASGFYATVGGGRENTAGGDYATVGGGERNTAGYIATVGGGYANTAIGWYATVGGGQENTASGDLATVGGGINNTASGFFATVGGGVDNTAIGWYATIGGGEGNTASGDYSAIPGGYNLQVGHRSFGFSGQTTNATTNLSAFPNIAAFVDVDLWLYSRDLGPSQLRFYEAQAHSSGAEYVAFQAPNTLTTSTTYTLPADLTAGTLVSGGRILQSDGGGNLSWLDPAELAAATAWALTGNDGTNPAVNFLGTRDAQPLVIRTDNTERVRITAAGDVGIGTSTPGARLHVEDGEIWLFNNGNNPRFVIGDGPATGQYGWLQWDSNLDLFRIDHSSAPGDGLKLNGNFVSIGNLPVDQPLKVGLGTTEYMRVTTTGNVGIGTTAPAARLDVNGTVAFSATATLTNTGSALTLPSNVAVVQIVDGAGAANISVNPPTTGTQGQLLFIRYSGTRNLTLVGVMPGGGNRTATAQFHAILMYIGGGWRLMGFVD
jgi:hypothetical protein